jgi:hypothetical protein
MDNQLYKQNIFVQKSIKKFNPDIITNKDKIENLRKETIFKQSKITYNSITNNTPDIIISNKDLELTKDKPINNIEFIINDKYKERMEQDILFKPIKQKIINEPIIEDNKIINNFIELKDDQTDFSTTQKKEIESNKNKYKNIILKLKNSKII